MFDHEIGGGRFRVWEGRDTLHNIHLSCRAFWADMREEEKGPADSACTLAKVHKEEYGLRLPEEWDFKIMSGTEGNFRAVARGEEDDFIHWVTLSQTGMEDEKIETRRIKKDFDDKLKAFKRSIFQEPFENFSEK